MSRIEPRRSAEEFRQMSADCYRREEESFQRSDTDGCFSQFCNNLSGQLYAALAKIVDNNHQITSVGLYNSNWERIPAILVHSMFNGRYVSSWKLRDDAAKEYGRRYIPYNSLRGTSRIMKSMGLCEKAELANGWAAIDDNGAKGFSGLESCYIKKYRTDDREWGMSATIIL